MFIALLCGWSSGFEDTSQDRQRIPGTLSGFRRNEYGSSPPTRGDSGNFSRGIHGRWDSRSIGRSDRDNDSQSDWDSGIFMSILFCQVVCFPLLWTALHIMLSVNACDSSLHCLMDVG